MRHRSVLAIAGVLLITGLTLQGCGSGGNNGGGGGGGTTTTTTSTTASTKPKPSDQIVNDQCSKSVVAADTQVDETDSLDEPIGWNPTGPKEGEGKWCEVQCPAADWNLKNYCSKVATQVANSGATGAAAQIKVLTYNLQWWANYQNWHPPNTINPALGENIVKDDKVQGFDLMGFQECEIIDALMDSAKKSGLSGNWQTYEWHDGKSIGIGIAWNTDKFDFISKGQIAVAEDQIGTPSYYGKRGAMWVRLTHKATGAPIFFLNHHGPTAVNTGGVCGPKATACNILKVIAENAMKGDLIFMTCDCNAWSMFRDNDQEPWKYVEEIGTLACHLPHRFTSPDIEDVWGIDNHFSNCAEPAKKGSNVLTAGTKMGTGGSDHHALSIVYDLPGSTQTETSINI